MKSKTSCFNRTILKKNVTHYWPLWASYLGILLLVVPFNIWQMTADEWYYEYYDGASRMYGVMYGAVSVMIDPWMSFLFAGVVALAVFSYLYSAKNANMMHALPVNRLELYVTNFLSGLSFLWIPQVIVFFVSVLVCLANEITCMQYLFLALLCQMGVSFFAYALAVFVAMFTGQILAMPAYYIIVNFLYVGCVFLVNAFMELLSFGITNRWNPGKSCMLSPLYYLDNNLWVREAYRNGSETSTGLEVNGVSLVAIYAIAAVVIIVIAYQIYKRRQIETAGDWVSVGFVKPIFRWGLAAYGGSLLALGFTNILQEVHCLNPYVCMVLSIIVTGFLCFFAAEMLLRKSFKVFQKKRVIEWAGFTAAAILVFSMFELDVFGVERVMPKEDEIAAAFVNMDYPVMVEKEDILELLAIHQDVVTHKKEYRELEQTGHGYYYTTFRYYMEDGSVFERRYPLPTTEEYIADETTPAAKILAWESEPEYLKQNLLGMDYEANRYISGYIDLYNEDGDYRNYMFSEEEAAEIAEAVEKDIDAGNYKAYTLGSVQVRETAFYINNISLDYYNKNGYNSSWDYYGYYNSYVGTAKQGTVREAASQANCYITFGPECEYTVKALEELGIMDDTWKLYTENEYYD